MAPKTPNFTPGPTTAIPGTQTTWNPVPQPAAPLPVGPAHLPSHKPNGR